MPAPQRDSYTIKLACPRTEVNEAFLQGMANRMAVSHAKYGEVAAAYPEKVSALDSASQRVDLYLETKNTEYLIDAANFMMIEFMCPSVQGAEFTPTDSDGSPGRVTADGEVSFERNDEI